MILTAGTTTTAYIWAKVVLAPCDALCQCTFRGCYFSSQNQSSLKPGPARPTSLKTVPTRPKIWPGREDVKRAR